MTDKAQEHNFPKYNLDADFWRNRWVESSAEALQQQLKLIKLEKKLATAVETLNYIVSSDREGSTRGYWEMKDKAKEALSEIGDSNEN